MRVRTEVLRRLAPPRRLHPDLVVRWPATYDWRLTFQWAESLRAGLAEQARLVSADIPQPYERLILFELQVGSLIAPVAIDYADVPELRERCAPHVLRYFKMQYRRSGYSLSNVVPGGYVPGNPRLYAYLRALRALRDAERYEHDVLGRFGMGFAADTRRNAISLLRGQSRFRFTGGAQAIPYSRFMREVARARVCLDLPGNGDFCFRLVDGLAVGSCIVAVRHGNTLPQDLVDGVHIAFVREDLSDLVDTCRRYVEDVSARERMARNARAYFDAHLHRRQLAAYYLGCCVQALPLPAAETGRGESIGQRTAG